MATVIHPSAIVSPKATLGANVRIDAYAIVEDDVVIGDNTHLMYHAVLMNGARIGSDCFIYPGAVIAAAPQDLKYHGQETLAIVGDRTTLRECVTINKGSHTDAVRVGSDCLIMAYSHVGHDSIIGNHVILSNASQLGGHVEIGDWAILGGVTKVHQFCRVGQHAMVAADAMITKDVPPFALMGREPVKVEGINKVGLGRRGFSREQVDGIDAFYTTVFFSGLNMSDGIARYCELNPDPATDVALAISFIQSSKRGVYR